MFSVRRQKKQRQIADYIPWQGHVDDDIVMLDDGSLFAMFAIEGIAADTADVIDARSWHAEWNDTLRSIADDSLILYSYQCRGFADPSTFPDSLVKPGFAHALDEKYRQRLFDRYLFDNRLFIGLMLRPERYAGEVVGEQVSRRRPVVVEPPEQRMERLHRICDQFAKKMEAYRPTRLGIRYHNDFAFTEIGEALVFAMTGLWRPIGLTTGRLGNAMFSEDVISGPESIEFRTPGPSIYAAMFGLKEYPTVTRPKMLASLSSASYKNTVFQSFRFINKNTAEAIMRRKQNYMNAADDKASSQIEDLEKAMDEMLNNEFVLGDHAISLSVFSETIEDLQKQATDAWRHMGECGAVIVRENAALEAALVAMIPGNERYRTRPGYVTSRNLASFAPLYNSAKGAPRGHWGQPIAVFRTLAGTPYRYHWHVGDVGNTLICGETGSGKSLLTSFLITFTAARARIICLDYKRGWEIMVRGMGGAYAVLGGGQPHLAPLKALDNTSVNRQFLGQLIRGCITSHMDRPMTDEEDRRLALGLDILMEGPAEERSLRELRAFMGTASDGAGAALNKWCWGNELGWVLDAPIDTISLNRDLYGLDMTALLRDERARGPALYYIFHLIFLSLNGQPTLISTDEGWRSLQDETYRPMIEEQLRTIRSRGGIFVFLTQSPSEIIEAKIGDVLIEQCPTRIFLPNERGQKAHYIDGMKLKQGEWEAFHKLKKLSRKFLLCQGGDSTVLELSLEGMQDEIAVLSSNDQTLKVLDGILEELHDLRPHELLEEFQRRRQLAIKPTALEAVA